ncbi:class II glutamine amidotransferase [Consotaella salsifontis]|uniref:Glutamine amidotransferase n=1 Tax=Consotaella salsifontis TaxID=1365950 RepID=A0A1T4T5H1_9HYPH|nr:class II glutamine amidotransferase [Consotaella salsifontis]SKA35418.1 glutamine amidotransferase [Consotaella salsifontis]
MCRFLAYCGSPILIDTLLVAPRSSLIAQARAAREAPTPVNGDGCGIGWYGERPEPGLYRNVLPAWGDANLASLCHQVRSRLFFAHVRAATSGEVAGVNCHPFASGHHLFMHNGQIGGYQLLRRRIDALIPDALYPERKGTTDSEAIFLAALGQGLREDAPAAMERTLGAIWGEMARMGATEPLRFAAAHSDGKRLFAYRWASDGHPPSLYWRVIDEGFVVASEPCGEMLEAWNMVPSGTVLTIEASGAARLAPFTVERPAAKAGQAAA